MADIVDQTTRSRMMSGIKNKNTKPEIAIRKLLYKRGFRYRLHTPKLPGKPDIVLNKYNAVIFIHGCFWHGHDCRLFKWPKSHPEFWKKKIEYNRHKDQKVMQELKTLGCRICVIWECSIKYAKTDFFAIIEEISIWLRSDSYYMELRL